MVTSQNNAEFPAPVATEIEAPPGTEMPDVQWVHVAVSGCGVMLAAVARPPGTGSFPTVLLLHGTHGFAQEYVHLTRGLAEGGLLAMATCWFQGGSGAGSRFITPISCPEAPAMPDASSPEAVRTVDSLVEAARSLPGANPNKVGIFGHSRGGGAALHYIRQKADVQAAVLNSSSYPTEPAGAAAQVKAPILILHGTADSPDDGGSAATDIKMALDFEAALLAAGKHVQAVFYEGGRHNSIFTSPAQREDEVQQTCKFLLCHLRSEC